MQRTLAIVAFLVLTVFALRHWGTPRGELPGAGDPIGDVRAELLDGADYRLPQPPGRVLVLNFFATWCKPCRAEVPLLNELEAEGTQVLGVSVDTLSPEQLKNATAKMAIHYPVARDTKGLADRLGVDVIPSVFVVGRDGRIAESYRGGVSASALRAAVTAANAR